MTTVASGPSFLTAVALANALQVDLYNESVAQTENALYALVRQGETKWLAVIASGDAALPEQVQGETHKLHLAGRPINYRRAPLDAANASALRGIFDWLRPRCLGLSKSVGCGDRLGLATPGHARAVASSRMQPIFAQQSIRENDRTGRTPQQVLDDAMWGVFQVGWRQGYGADADHLKKPEHIDQTAAAGYTFYTIDPGEHVVSRADHFDDAELVKWLEGLPWDALEDSPEDLRRRYLGRTVDLGSLRLACDERSLLVGAVKYGQAVAHTATMYRHLLSRQGEGHFELEVSVDETDSPTSHLEHYYIASELKRLGVRWVSLAPRFVGRFEKGADYQGEAGGLTDADLTSFRADFAGHVAVAQALGPYKMSLHSGSDKFSVYPIAAELAGNLVHLKTAGTSYLEALRAVARVEPALFRTIYTFARERYPLDRATYHVSAQESRMPDAAVLDDADLPDLLDQFDARQALHVTFGSVLTARDEQGNSRFKEPLLAVLRSHESEHYAALETHFRRHLAPFSG